MPGLVRGIARTAVVAGTATAVSGRVQRRQAEKYADRDAQIAADREQAYEQQMPATPAPAAAPQDDMVEQLSKLGEMKQQGLLSDDEFAAAKARLLGG
jgi:hypothetical protein